MDLISSIPIIKELTRNLKGFKIKMDEDKTAQYRFSSLLVEQSVYTIAERKAMESGEKGLIIDSNAPVTSLRKFIDKKTNEFSPKILKIIIKK